MVTKMAAPYRELLHVMLYYYPLEGENVKIGCHLLFFGPKILANTPYFSVLYILQYRAPPPTK